MRKIFVCLLVFAVVLSSVALAASSIEVWQIHSPIPEIMNAFDWAAQEFEAETGIKVNMVRIPTEDLHTKLVVSISAGQYPDLLIWNIRPGLEFQGLGVVEEVSSVIDEVGRDNFPTATLTMFQAPLGKQWEIPLFARLAGYHYWKDWLLDAGLDPNPTVLDDGSMVVNAYNTWDDVLETSKKLTKDLSGDGTIDQYGAGFQYNRKGFGDSAAYAFSVITTFGGHLFDSQTGEVVINSPQTVAAYQFMKDIYKSGVMPPGVVAWDGYDNNKYFMDRTVGFIVNSNSVISNVRENDPELADKIGVTIAPAHPETGLRTYSGSPDTMTIFKTDNTDSAKEFAKFLLKANTQVEMFKIMGVGYYGPLLLNVMADPFFSEIGEQERMFVENNKYFVGPEYPGVPSPELITVALAVYNGFVYDDALTRISVDDWSPEDAVKEIEKRVLEMLEER
ncbi:MAG: multiple sugar transport system substrate-binding protein [Candidatus Atribacteria bacterium]|nr:multiple sugar transport system substrate-binding protein [Candidatus Atribacteria bacterium]